MLLHGMRYTLPEGFREKHCKSFPSFPTFWLSFLKDNWKKTVPSASVIQQTSKISCLGYSAFLVFGDKSLWSESVFLLGVRAHPLRNQDPSYCIWSMWPLNNFSFSLFISYALHKAGSLAQRTAECSAFVVEKGVFIFHDQNHNLNTVLYYGVLKIRDAAFSLTKGPQVS